MATVTEEDIEASAIAAPPIERRRFTADEFERMAEVGIIGDQERVELIGGEIVVMSRIGSLHASCRMRLNRLFSGRIVDEATVGIQAPVRLGDHSLVVPDVALFRPRDDYYASGHPRPADVFVLIEIMDGSIAYDRNVKLPLYARSGILEVWLADVHSGEIEAHRRPNGGCYLERQVYRIGDELAPVAFPGMILRIDEIVPR